MATPKTKSARASVKSKAALRTELLAELRRDLRAEQQRRRRAGALPAERVAVAVAAARRLAVAEPVTTLERVRSFVVEISDIIADPRLGRAPDSVRESSSALRDARDTLRATLRDVVRLLETLEAQDRTPLRTMRSEAATLAPMFRDVDGPLALKLMIKGEGITARAFAERLGVGESTVSAWIRGRKRPGARAREALQILGIDASAWPRLTR